MKEYNGRIRIIDVQDHATRAWTTRASFAARHTTAERQPTALTRYEERALLRTKIEHQAYDRYYVTVDLAADLELQHDVPRPGADETLETYIEERDTFLEILVNELTSRREKPLIEERLRQIAGLKLTIDDYAAGGLTVPVPTFPVPTTLAEAIAVYEAWKQVFNMVKAEVERRARERELEEERLDIFLARLESLRYRAPEEAEAFAMGFETFVANDVLPLRELERARHRVEDLAFQSRKVIADHIYARRVEQTRRREEAERYQAIRDWARHETERRMSERMPFITDLRYRDDEGEFIYSSPAQRQAHLEMNVSPHHQGVPWIRMSQKKRRRSSNTRHYMRWVGKRIGIRRCFRTSQHIPRLLELGYTMEERSIDLRREWRREHRELTKK
jgi:hypothetical protein